MSLIIATLYLSKGVRAFKSLFDQKFGRCFRFSCLKGVYPYLNWVLPAH